MILENAKATFEQTGTGWTYYLIDYYDPTEQTRTPAQDSPVFERDVQGNYFETDKIYIAVSEHPVLGDNAVPFMFDLNGIPYIIGGSSAGSGNGSPVNTNTLGGYDMAFQTPESGDIVSFYRLPNNRLVVINQPLVNLLPTALQFGPMIGADLHVYSLADDLDRTDFD